MLHAKSIAYTAYFRFTIVVKATGRLKTQVLENASTEKASRNRKGGIASMEKNSTSRKVRKRKYGKGKYRPQVWNSQVWKRKVQVAKLENASTLH